MTTPPSDDKASERKASKKEAGPNADTQPLKNSLAQAKAKIKSQLSTKPPTAKLENQKLENQKSENQKSENHKPLPAAVEPNTKPTSTAKSADLPAPSQPTHSAPGSVTPQHYGLSNAEAATFSQASQATYRSPSTAIQPFGQPIESASPQTASRQNTLKNNNTTNTKGRFGLPKVPKVIKGTFWAIVFGATACGAAGLGTLAVLTFPLPSQVSGETVAPPLADLWRSGFRYQVSRPVNILLMGLDEAYDVPGAQPGDLVGRTDTMLLARVDPEEKVVNVMSIPRDTRVEIPGYGIDKINEANFEGGAELAAQTVTYNFDNVNIDRYVRVSTGAFREIVDLVGGIEVLVPKEMKYEDKTQGLVIDLQPGLQNLNGDEAEQFARFRQDSYGDIGRVQRQQILLKALRQRMMNPTVLPKLPQIVRVLQEHIDTNLTVEEMLALAGFGLNLDSKDLHMVMLPGRFSDPEEYSASYWISDSAASSDLMRTYFDTNAGELVANSSGINYYEPPSDWAVNELKIAVQNATEDPYASSSMAEYLRDQGFYNVYVVRDWADVDRKTSVVVQRGDVGSARSLQNMLDIGQLVADSTGDIDSDITIRVGEDWLLQVDPTWKRLPYDGPR